METEVLNQEPQTEEVEGFFDDYEETPSKEVVEEPVEETPTQEVVEKPFLEIKYDKETKGLSQDEARELAQKGMNYDRILEKYNSLNDTLDALARRNEMSVADFLTRLEDTQMQYEIGNELDALKELYPNTNEDALMELAKARVKDKNNIRTQQVADKKNEQDNAQAEALRHEVEMLQREFPDVDIHNLPDEVFDYANDGLSLLSAYYKYQRGIDEKNRSVQEAKAKVDKINEANKSKSYGDMNNAGDIKEDDFLSGLYSI